MWLKKYIINNLPTYFLVLSLVGFELAMILFIPTVEIDLAAPDLDLDESMGITQVVTIPYRILILGIMIYLLYKYKVVKSISTRNVTLFQILWVLWLIRLIFDACIRSDIPVNFSFKQLVFIILSFVDLFVIKKIFRFIDWNLAYKLTLLGYIICVFGMLIKNPFFLLAADEVVRRQEGVFGLNPISTASLAAGIPIMFIFINRYFKINWLVLVAMLLITVVGVVIMLRASSRGPLISLVLTIALYMLFRSKNTVKGLCLCLGTILCILFFKDFCLSLLHDVSPVLAERFNGKDGSTLEREFLYNSAINGFLSNPLFGFAHGVLWNGGIGYPHNLILEAFNALGVVGGVLTIVLMVKALKASYRLVHFMTPYGWIGLLITMQLIQGMFSGKFYGEERLTILWVLVYLLDSLCRKENLYNLIHNSH